MTISEDKDGTQPELTVSEPAMKKTALQKIGGFDLLSFRPVIGKSQNVFVISGQNVRNYSTESGAFLDEYSFGNSSPIIAIQPNPLDDNELVVVSANGNILHWSVANNIKRAEAFLQLKAGSSVTSFYQVGDRYYYTINVKEGQKKKKYGQLFFCPKKHLTNVSAINSEDRINHRNTFKSVAFGPVENPEFCATLYEDNLYIYQIPVKVDSIRQVHSIKQNKTLTCIAFHPSDAVIATGDSLGQITIWNNILSSTPSKNIMHWHSLQVNDLAFSPSGTSLYSVGNEMVLVKWNLVGQFAGEKDFMPRLGSAIHNVVASSEMIITSLKDQTMQIIDSQMNGVRTVIEGLTIGFNSENRLAAGLHYNSRLKSLVLNGRVGHVQLYCPSTQKQLFQLDIAEQNVVSEVNLQPLKERLKSQTPELTKIFPIEVTKIAVSEDGGWMATVEYRDDQETLPEIRMKFWRMLSGSFSLNTTIHLPHQEKITFIVFSPVSPDGAVHLVSTSVDRSFKIWDLNSDDDKVWWNCSRTASLNSYSVPRQAAFSADRSLLTVLFDNIVTLWELDSSTTIRYIPRMDIFKLQKSKRIIFLAFGTDNLSHYLIEGRQRDVTVRNILKKFDVVYTYKCEEPSTGWSSISLNSHENVLALISRSAIQLFSLQTGSVILQLDFVNIAAAFTGEIVTSIFAPEVPTRTNTRLPLKRSTFYCLNERHELFKLVAAGKGDVFSSDNVTLVGTEESQKTKLYMQRVQSQLSLMLTNKTKSKGPAGELGPDVSGTEVNLAKNRKLLVEKYFYNVPSHVLPPVAFLEKSFLVSYMQCLNLSGNSTQSRATEEDEDEEE